MNDMTEGLKTNLVGEQVQFNYLAEERRGVIRAIWIASSGELTCSIQYTVDGVDYISTFVAENLRIIGNLVEHPQEPEEPAEPAESEEPSQDDESA